MKNRRQSAKPSARNRLLKQALDHPEVLGIGFYVIFVLFYFLATGQP